MHAGEQQGLDDGVRPARVGLARGVAVIVAAIAIGGTLLVWGVGDRTESIDAAASTTTVSDEGSPNDLGATSSTPDSAVPATSEAGVGAGSTIVPAEPGSTQVDPTATTVPPPSETVPPSPVSTAAAPIDGPAGVRVLVLNATSKKGVAGKGTELLKGAGYNMLAPKNADALGPSKVLYAEGSLAVAEAVAGVLKVDPAKTVAPLDPAAPPTAAIGNADVIVVIGTDGIIQFS